MVGHSQPHPSGYARAQRRQLVAEAQRVDRRHRRFLRRQEERGMTCTRQYVEDDDGNITDVDVELTDVTTRDGKKIVRTWVRSQ